LTLFPKVSRKWIEDEIQKSRDRGYTLFLNMLVDRMGAVGVPIIGPEGKPIGALAVAALSDRISSRLENMVEMLKREADVVADVRKT
ncbi:MAG TPA: IclR family transcriptional regulator C-terminal domain-containing protein, partial [Burkholderiales bacterium]